MKNRFIVGLLSFFYLFSGDFVIAEDLCVHSSPEALAYCLRNYDGIAEAHTMEKEDDEYLKKY